MTPEQQKAAAKARARRRRAEAEGGQQGGVLSSVRQKMDDVGQGVLQGATFGFGDEIMAGALTPVEMAAGAVRGDDWSPSASYGRALDREREGLAEARERSPGATMAGEVAGGVATGGTLARGGATLLNVARPTTGAMVGRGAAEGAAYGAAYGAGTGEGVEGRARGAATGAAVGGAAGGAMGAIGAGMAAREGRRAAPSTDQLRQQADALYRQADQAGVVVAQPRFDRMADGLQRAARESGFNRRIHPRVAGALREITGSKGSQPTLRDLDIMRRQLGAAAKSMEADERRVATQLIDRLDTYVSNLRPSDVVSGDARQATQAIRQARDLWKRMRKGEIVENLVERAGNRAGQFSGSGYENALRTEFRNLLQNPRRMRGFSNEEKAAIARVARGGPIENALRALGRFAPRGVVSGGFHAGVGAVGGWPVAAGTLAVGEGARRGATAMTSANAQNAAALARSGGQLVPQLTGPQRAAIQGITGEAGRRGSGLPILNEVGVRTP